MSEHFLNHDACPRCRRKGEDRAGNNLAVYSDHVYCFKCGYRAKVSNGKSSLTEILQEQGSSQRGDEVRKQGKKDILGSITLPDDFILQLPRAGADWISKYNLTDRELIRNRIGWSDSGLTLATASGNLIQYSPCMIFPVYDIYGNLLMYQARYFGNSTNLPKYLTKGKPASILHILGTNEEQPIVIVEDLISAIKVSRVYRAIPIFGSTPSMDWFHRIRNVTPSIILWLDKDKRTYSEQLCKRLSLLFESVRTITTELDPKEYDEYPILETS